MGGEAGRRRWRGTAVAAAGAVAVGTALIATSGDGVKDGDRYRGCGAADASYDAAYPDFPAGSAQEWVSYGDHVAVFHPRPGSERPARGGDPRSAVLVVDEVLHSRPGAKPLPDSFRTELWDVPCDSRVQAGHTYLGLLVFDAVRNEPPVWRPVHGAGLLPYDGESIGTGETEGKVGEVPAEERSPFGLEKQMHGEHAATLRSLLEQTEPYALAAGHPKMSPGERHALVAAAREEPAAREEGARE